MPALELFGQSLDWTDLGIVALLVLLEGVLSIDNALVLGLLAKRLPKSQQARALTYGLVGAFVFRIIAIGMASLLLQWRIVKLIGGGYLVYIAIKHLFFERHETQDEKLALGAEGEPTLSETETGAPLTPEHEIAEIEERVPVPLPEDVASARAPRRLAKFWPTVMVIELTDIAFAIDSILAAIALVASPPEGHPPDALHPKLWVVVSGGILGVVLMRFAAVIFIKLLERFPRFETAAYLLVIVIGGKLLADWGFNSPEHPHRVDFHDFGHPAFWTFWTLMLICFFVGFIPRRQAK
ncbi:MAG: TerC family protein [Planctomycetaceae bacterium]